MLNLVVTMQGEITCPGLKGELNLSMFVTQQINMSVAVKEHCTNPSMAVIQQINLPMGVIVTSNNASIYLLINGCQTTTRHLLETVMQQCFDL